MALALFRKRTAATVEADIPEPAISAPSAPAAEVVRDPAKDILGLLELELGAMIRQLEHAAASVAGGADGTAATLQTIRQRTDALTGRASTATQTAAAFTEAADRFTSSADGINHQVREASRLADQASTAAADAGANVDRLRESSAAIDTVVNLIATIAKQTTLLALNSTIEAARAGEAGRGFAVVASEVKTLAVQTQLATEEIKKKIDALQQDAASSIDAVHRISTAIDAIRPVFGHVNEAVVEQGVTTGEVVSNASTASSFIASVGDSAADIDGATRQAEAHGSTVAQAGEAMMQLTEKLKARCAVLLRREDHTDWRMRERLPCHLDIEITGARPIKAAVYELALEGLLIGGSSAQSLPLNAQLAATLDGIGACQIRCIERTQAGMKAVFVAPDAALSNAIEDRLWAIHDENTEFVTRAMQAGETLSKMFDDATSDGAVTLDDLFDENYVAIPNTDPVQHRTRFLDWTERTLPAFQEAFLAKDKRMAFSIAVDRNGYLPVHNKVYSQPQRPGDVAWNTANSRNRRIFNDPAGLAAGRNTRAYLIQSYARDMGNGVTVMMCEIDVPIWVQGRHWGGFRTAYKL
ncbi:MAG: methyl-accepting chemotaxis protein [Rhizobiales bacterium]|nr:methyl-accepting chemotaxis protein [Hyphomicrobiales bacterium]